MLTETRLLWLALGFAMMSDVGAHVDAWYHVHYGFEIESFFTWAHALFYSAKAGFGLVVVLYLVEGVVSREPRGARLPRGYPLVLLGSGLFLLGGAFDFGWHALFGFEVNLETLLSPSHLWLVIADMIALLGLLQVAVEYRRRHAAGSSRPRLVDLPVLFSLGLLFRGAQWNLFYSDPLAVDYASGGVIMRGLAAGVGMGWDNLAAEVSGTTGVMLHSVLLALFLVVPLRRLRLPFGAATVVMLWNGWLTVAVTEMWRYLPAVVTGAVVGEAVWAWLWRGGLGGLDGDRGYWILAFAVPLAQFAAYFGLMAVVDGLIWSVHLTAGTPLMAGFYGLIASLFAIPPGFLRGRLDTRAA